MIRVIERNSQDHTCVEDLTELKEDLARCGHNLEKLEETEPQAVSRVLENSEPGRSSRENDTKEQSNLVFSVQHSQDNKELKKLIHDLEPDIIIKRLCGEIRIIFATRKHPSEGNRIVKNRQLGQPKTDLNTKTSQKCFSRGCSTLRL